MILIADADFPYPVVAALKAVRFPAFTLADLDIPVRPDTAVMEHVLAADGILATLDTGIPSQAYLHQYGQRGLTIIVARLKPQAPDAWQRMTALVLMNWEEWQRTAAEAPSLITLNWAGVRTRPWGTLPPEAAGPAQR